MGVFRGALSRPASCGCAIDYPRRRGGADLADSLYAELYGFGEGDGVRRPLLAYFHGRSSLRTWMRAVMAQRHIDSLRAARRREAIYAVADPEIRWEQSDPKRALYIEAIAQSLSAALDELKARDRMRLNFYYSDELTLKQIGELMNESESSASRRLARTRKQIRRVVERKLRRERHLDEEQIRLCYVYSMEAGTADVGPLLANSRAAGRSQSNDERDSNTRQAGAPVEQPNASEAQPGRISERDGK
jgi:RNA polymerase sigma factor (sigma-70 family)